MQLVLKSFSLKLVFKSLKKNIFNGGFREPNKGINYPNTTLGVDYTLEPLPFEDRLKEKYQGKKNWEQSLFFMSWHRLLLNVYQLRHKTMSYHPSKLFFFFLLAWSLCIHPNKEVFASRNDTLHKQPLNIGINQHFGFIIIHSREIRAIKDSYPVGTEITLGRQKMDEKAWNICHCYPKTGLLVSFFDFDNRKILGYGFNLAGFVEPFFRSHKQLNISIRSAAGLSYDTRPYDPLDNPENLSYSFPINGYLQLGLALHYRLNNHFKISLAGNYNHISNGGFREPNKGINYPTATLGLDYTLDPLPFEDRLKEKYQGNKNRYFMIGLSAFPKRIFASPAYFGIFGISAGVSQQVGRMNALTLDAEWVWDGSLKWRMENQLNSSQSYQRGGLLVGHEFLMGRFTFSQKIGAYLYDKTQYNDPVYQRYGINFRLTEWLVTGIHLKAHRHVADLLELRLSYCWNP